MLEVALLIFAIAFAVMVGVFIPIGVKLYKTVDVVTSNKKAMEFLDKKSQTAIYEILAKANVLVEDVNGKVSTIDPLFVAVADLSESVSDLNAQARRLSQKATQATSNVGKASAAYAIGKVASKLLKKETEHE